VTDHYRRELFIGLDTVVIIEGNKVFPALGDWYLARTGYESQQTREPADPYHPDNLWKPVDEERDYRAHGDFNERARWKSWQVWANTHIGLLALLGTVGIAAIARGIALLRRLP
jgi:hypothetical protein